MTDFAVFHEKLLRLPAVKLRTALSKSGIYQKIAQGTFPAPFKANSMTSVWKESEIDSWINSLSRKGS